MLLTPTLKTDSHLLNSAFRVAMGDLVGNIQPFKDGLLSEPQPCILAGLEYDTPWTRDTAINIWNGAGLIFPAAARSTLLSVLELFGEEGAPLSQKVHIGGQYWDAMIWTTGAWAYYLYTGDREMLSLALEATLNSLEYFETTEYDPTTGLFRGPACYGDGVAAYPDLYARTSGSSSILDWPKCNPDKIAVPGVGIPMHALSTNCLYYHAYILLDQMAAELGHSIDPAWRKKAEQLQAAINLHFWDAQRENYRYLVDPWGGSDHQEGLGSSFAVLLGVASPAQAAAVLRSQVITPNGIPCVWPSFKRYRLDDNSFGRHSGTVWPHIQGFWAEVAARSGDAPHFRFELFKLAELAVRDGMFAEIYHPITGAVYGGLQEGAPGWYWHACRRQTWSATAFLRMVLMGLIGMDFSPRGAGFMPLLPEGVTRMELRGLPYRKARLNISINGTGSEIIECRINGRRSERAFLDAGVEGDQELSIQVG
jgi:glycogen debranching enzyme